MKILYISNSRIPTEKAHGIQLFKMCQAFSIQTSSLELILPTRQSREFKNIDPFEYYQVKDNFKIKKVKSTDPTWLMKLPQGIYIKFQLVFFIFSMYFYLKKKSNLSKYIFYTRDEYLLTVLQKFSKQVVWEAHTLPVRKKHYLKYWRKCYKIITISQGLKNELISLGLEGNKILVAPDGVDLEEFNIQYPISNIRKKFNLPLNKKLVIYAGHLYSWKGAQVLADAAQYLDDGILVVFIGGTEHDIKDFKAKNKHKKNILILGHKPHRQISYYLKAADVLILPNSAINKKSIFWTSPLKLFEYMASGTPIVASGLPSIKEILNSKNSILFETDNPQKLAQAIKQLLDNPPLAKKLSMAAYTDVQNYTWQKRAEKIIEFII